MTMNLVASPPAASNRGRIVSAASSSVLNAPTPFDRLVNQAGVAGQISWSRTVSGRPLLNMAANPFAMGPILRNGNLYCRFRRQKASAAKAITPNAIEDGSGTAAAICQVAPLP